jgi:hypothetical protein
MSSKQATCTDKHLSPTYLWFTELDFILLHKLQLGSVLAIFGSVGVVG